MYRSIFIGMALASILFICLSGGISSGKERVFLAAPSQPYKARPIPVAVVDVRWPQSPNGKDIPIIADKMDFFTISVYTDAEIDKKYKELQEYAKDTTKKSGIQVKNEVVAVLNKVVKDHLQPEVIRQVRDQARKELKEELREEIKDELYRDFKARLLQDKDFLKQLAKQLQKSE